MNALQYTPQEHLSQIADRTVAVFAAAYLMTRESLPTTLAPSTRLGGAIVDIHEQAAVRAEAMQPLLPTTHESVILRARSQSGGQSGFDAGRYRIRR